MADEDGVLGNLPRSRPGRRSAKRETHTAGAAAQRAERTGAPAARPAASSTRAPKVEASPRAEERREASNPISGALRVGAKVAGTGLRIATGVAGHVLRRLPRP